MPPPRRSSTVFQLAWVSRCLLLLAFYGVRSVNGISVNQEFQFLTRLQHILQDPKNGVSELCRDHTNFYLGQLRVGVPWALKKKVFFELNLSATGVGIITYSPFRRGMGMALFPEKSTGSHLQRMSPGIEVPKLKAGGTEP